ncbi:hypothetical protein YC2023_053981 [Brassica napus]
MNKMLECSAGGDSEAAARDGVACQNKRSILGNSESSDSENFGHKQLSYVHIRNCLGR